MTSDPKEVSQSYSPNSISLFLLFLYKGEKIFGVGKKKCIQIGKLENLDLLQISINFDKYK
jgi:hypothetical protein